MSDKLQSFTTYDTSVISPTRHRPRDEDAPPPGGVDIGRLFGLIGDIYGTISTPDNWRTALDGMSRLTGASHIISGVFDVHRPEVHRHSATSSLTNSELLRLLNLATEERFERFLELYKMPPRTLMHYPDPNAAPHAEPDGFIKELQRRFGVQRLVSANANPNHSWFDYATLFYGEKSETEMETHNAAIRYLLPHIAQANAARRPLELLKQKYEAVFSVLDRLAFGVVLVDADRTIIAANQAAKAMMEDRDALRRTSDGRLATAVAESETELAARIFAAAQTAHREAAHVARHFTVARRSGGVGMILEATPFIETNAGELNAPLEGAIVFCIDPESEASLDPRGMAQAFRFTPTETTICGHLLDGLSNEEIAEAQDISITTVKTHTKALFSKSRTANRTALVRLAASVSPPLTDEV